MPRCLGQKRVVRRRPVRVPRVHPRSPILPGRRRIGCRVGGLRAGPGERSPPGIARQVLDRATRRIGFPLARASHPGTSRAVPGGEAWPHACHSPGGFRQPCCTRSDPYPRSRPQDVTERTGVRFGRDPVGFGPTLAPRWGAGVAVPVPAGRPSGSEPGGRLPSSRLPRCGARVYRSFALIGRGPSPRGALPRLEPSMDSDSSSRDSTPASLRLRRFPRP
jgi:hypothetical protein